MTWEAARTRGAWLPGYGTYRYLGRVRQGDQIRACGHAHRKQSRADACSAALARQLNRKP